MTREPFENQLRRFIRQEPFEPFAVLMANGERLIVEVPSVAFDGGVAGYIGPKKQITVFKCEDVLDIVAVVPESKP